MRWPFGLNLGIYTATWDTSLDASKGLLKTDPDGGESNHATPQSLPPLTQSDASCSVSVSEWLTLVMPQSVSA